MPSHQSRRDPLPQDYQHPTPKCSHAFVYSAQHDAYQCARCYIKVTRFDHNAGPLSCPKCLRPSFRGDLCVNCTSEAANATPWGV